ARAPARGRRSSCRRATPEARWAARAGIRSHARSAGGRMTEKHDVFADDWQEIYPQIEGWRSNVRRLAPPRTALGMSVYELPPGQTQCPYHFHHGNEEMILVLRGRPTLRRPDDEE